MQMTDILTRAGGLQSIARELGLTEGQVISGASALLPAILGGFKKQAQIHPRGIDGLGMILGRLGGGSLLDDVLSPNPTNISRGNEVLGKIFGSKDVSRAVAQHGAPHSGLSPELLKKLLPMLAMAVAGFLARQRAGPSAAPTPAGVGGAGDVLGKLFGREEPPSRGGTARAGPAGLAAMLELDQLGNPLDDILRREGQASR